MAELQSLKRYALLSICAALLTIGLKTAAYLITGSVGLLSDALESVVNLAAAITALIALTVAARPADEEHAYGHTKAEYFASGFEGALILFAAGTIAVSATRRLMDPEPIQAVALGLTVSAVATIVNLWVARLLGRAGKRFGSIALEADAQHLMTDVWTSIGVVAGVAGVALTGWQWLDAVIALFVAANIVRIGVVLLRRSMLGLLDTALPEELRATIIAVLERHQRQGVEFHALRSRQAGVRRFVSLHILVPGDWSVQRGHDLLEQIEEEIRAEVPKVTVFTHLEPLEDPASWEDTQLERPGDMPMPPRTENHPPTPPALH